MFNTRMRLAGGITTPRALEGESAVPHFCRKSRRCKPTSGLGRGRNAI